MQLLTILRATFLVSLTQSWIFGLKYLEAGLSCTKEESFITEKVLNQTKWAGIIIYFVIETTLLTFSVIQFHKFEKSYYYEERYKYLESYRNLCGSTAIVGLLLMLISSILGMIGIWKIIKIINLLQKSNPDIKSKKCLLVLHIIVSVL